ncbi:hypothetical protein GCM10027299_03070 [Larkinella ripae]
MTPGSKTGVTAHNNRLLANMSKIVTSVELITPDDAPVLIRKALSLLGKIADLLGKNSPILFREASNFISIWIAVRKHANREIDLIHAQDVNSGAAASTGLGKEIPTVVTCHFNTDPITEYDLHYGLSAWGRKKLLAWYTHLFRQHRTFITVSNYTRKTSAFLRPEGAVCEVIHNGVVFPDQNSKPTALGLPLNIVNIGTLEHRKNQLLLIETAHQLRTLGFRNFKMWLVGDGPKRYEWEKVVAEKTLQEFVCFAGFQSDVSPYLAQADLYVHTATEESWGYAITEAIASGTPVLALATGGIPEQFDAHQPGLLPKDATPAELATLIQSHQSPEKRKQLAQEQFRFARDNFTLDAMIDKHLIFYQAILADQPYTELSTKTALTP